MRKLIAKLGILDRSKSCAKCGQVMGAGQEMVWSRGRFYHIDCQPMLPGQLFRVGQVVETVKPVEAEVEDGGDLPGTDVE